MLESTTRILHAVAANQVARWAPALYVRLTRQTGRGAAGEETPADIARYFLQCVQDYFSILKVPNSERSNFLKGKQVLEYGPGDLPGVALLLVALGAERVFCVDRFPMVMLNEKNRQVIDFLRSELNEPARSRFDRCICSTGGSVSAIDPDRVQYVVRHGGLSGMSEEIDLVISRAVMEHVGDLEATFFDMARAMRPGALAVHQVDLKSHGLHRDSPLDFLCWKRWAWDLMHSHKGVPNRWRVDRYRSIIGVIPVETLCLEPTAHASAGDIAAVRGHLAKPFRGLSDEDLAWLGFWLVFRKLGT